MDSPSENKRKKTLASNEITDSRECDENKLKGSGIVEGKGDGIVESKGDCVVEGKGDGVVEGKECQMAGIHDTSVDGENTSPPVSRDEEEPQVSSDSTASVNQRLSSADLCGDVVNDPQPIHYDVTDGSSAVTYTSALALESGDHLSKISKPVGAQLTTGSEDNGKDAGRETTPTMSHAGGLDVVNQNSNNNSNNNDGGGGGGGGGGRHNSTSSSPSTAHPNNSKKNSDDRSAQMQRASMTPSQAVPSIVVDRAIVNDANTLLWGKNPSNDIFLQWFQGFNFSIFEPSCLLQTTGGPCALIAPLQAFILRRLLFIDPVTDWRGINEKKQDKVLVDAVFDIITAINTDHYCVMDVHYEEQVGMLQFTHNLSAFRTASKSALRSTLARRVSSLRSSCGVLMLLYSLVLTKGVSIIRAELQDGDESLIERRFGHGGQSLINLAMTGLAVSNVFDGSKDCGGLVLRGIERQSEVGFLSLLEHLRYCEVGWYYKNPKYPIWVLGSETHLTVFFCRERGLVELDSSLISAKKIFNTYDDKAQGFIMNDKLGDLMRDLDLVSEPDYVNIMVEKLDPEKFGIITSHSFFEEFYADELRDSAALSSYDVYHYNGLCSAPDKEVQYTVGKATLAQVPEYQIINDTSEIKSCCLTKWPSIELHWNLGITPRLT